MSADFIADDCHSVYSVTAIPLSEKPMTEKANKPRKTPDDLLFMLNMRVYIQEMQRQAELGKSLHVPLLEAVRSKDGFQSFSLMAQLLNHNTQAMRVAFAPKEKNSSAKFARAALRRRWIRVALQISEPQFREMNQKIRNDFVHFDERLDTLLFGKRLGTAHHTEEAGRRRIYASSPRYDSSFGRTAHIYFEYVEHDDARFVICDEECSLMETIRLTNKLLGSAEQYLDNSATDGTGEPRLLEVYSKSGGKIDMAERLVFAK
jgi:hypothetical protein